MVFCRFHKQSLVRVTLRFCSGDRVSGFGTLPDPPRGGCSETVFEVRNLVFTAPEAAPRGVPKRLPSEGCGKQKPMPAPAQTRLSFGITKQNPPKFHRETPSRNSVCVASFPRSCSQIDPKQLCSGCPPSVECCSGENSYSTIYFRYRETYTIFAVFSGV